MGGSQNWEIFNVSRGEVAEMIGGHTFEFFFLHKQAYLVRSITIPFPSPKLKLIGGHKGKARMNRQRGLLSLPDEALRLIIKDPELSLPETVALALTCKRLFALSRAVLAAGIAACAAPWASDRIACVGHSTQYPDLPHPLLYDSDRAVIEYNHPGDLSSCCYGGLDRLCTLAPPNLWRGAFDQFQQDHQWLRRFTPHDREMFESVLFQTFPPGRKDWVLCNNTKREYVQASVIAELAGRPDDDQPFLPHCMVDLGHALLSRICWSTKDVIEKNLTRVHRGSWVGDKFCITTVDRRMKSRKGEPAWKDVSGEVAEDIKMIFKATFGRQWKQTLEGGPLPGNTWYWFACDGEDEVSRIGRQAPRDQY